MKRPAIYQACMFFLLAPVSLFCLCACWENAVMPGDLASVNGQGISFREAEARRVSLFARRSPGDENIDAAALQAQYRHVVAQIIEEVLVCQFMQGKGFVLSPEALAAEETRIRNDYPEGAFEEMLLEEGVSLDLWREGIRRRLTMEQFVNQELRPKISISSDEVQQYYREHKQDFVMPEQWHFMQITGLDKKEVERAQSSFIAGKNATAVQREFLVTIHDIRMGKDLLPEDMREDLARLGPWKGSRTRAHEETYRNFVLIKKIPESLLETAVVSQRVEQALAEEKMRATYENWMQKRLAKADIRMAPALTRPVVPREPAQENDPVPPLRRRDAGSDEQDAAPAGEEHSPDPAMP